MSGGEFDLIRKYFAPLATGAAGALDLTDDAAFLTHGNQAEPSSGGLAAENLVIAKDLLIADVHFRSSDPPADIARKALRVNLSDMAAMGAEPHSYLLGCAWPLSASEAFIASFAEGLAQDQETFGVTLLGGDTTAHRHRDGPLVVSVTMVGRVGAPHCLLRSGAVVGDDVYVSGFIGDAYLGLRADQLTVDEGARRFLDERYRLPIPRLALGKAIASIAHSAIDVSDGLLADAGHLGKQSGVCLVLEAERLPFSQAAAQWLSAEPDPVASRAALASGGDDYEVLFTAPPSARRALEDAARTVHTPITRIGCVKMFTQTAPGVSLVTSDGRELEIPSVGFDHFAP